MNILAIYDKSGPKYHRILVPVHVMQENNGVDVLVKYQPTEQEFAKADIVFFNRMIAGMPVATLLELRDKYGFKIVCDMDDHWILDPSHLLFHNYKKFGVSETIQGFMEAADAVFVTHDRLYNEVVQVNKNCHVLPNAIAHIDQFTVQKQPDDLVRFFWAGGVTHRNDLELLRRPIQLLKRDKLKLIMGGYVKDNPEWEAMAKIFTNDSSKNTAVIESLGVHEYYKIYSLCDVALIPLVNNSFNIHKSNLKILEAANIAAPVIVSKVHPYLDFPEDIVNYVTLHETWYSRIKKLANDESLRIDQGLRLQEYCDKHYNFNKINQERFQIFDSLIYQTNTKKKAVHESTEH